jgi:glycosyltransferase involved in cell wall biosynthesis
MSGPRPFISVIIPVHNGERFLAGAVQNVLDQAYEPLEVIVVDDGSTDGTAGVARTLPSSIRCLAQPNRGPSAARNRGLQVAAGDTVAFLDVDDRWSPCALTVLAPVLQLQPSVDIAQGLIRQMRWDGSYNQGGGLRFEAVSEPYQFINIGSALYRRSVFDKVGRFDENLRENEDTDWFLRAWECNVSKLVVNEVTLYYRLHDRNMSLAQVTPHQGLLRMIKRHLDRVKVRGAIGQVNLENIAGYIGGSPLRHPMETITEKEITIISDVEA